MSIITLLLVITVYLAPTFLANKHKHKKTASIFVINLLLGWTVIGWIICLAWALNGNTKDRCD